MYTIAMNSGCSYYNLLFHKCDMNIESINLFCTTVIAQDRSVEKPYKESMTQI